MTSLLDYAYNYHQYLIEKIADRIRRIVGDNNFIVGWSGGKDSTLLALICLKYFRKQCYLMYEHIVGNTHYANIQFINWFTRKYSLEKTIIRIAELRMLDKPDLPDPPSLIHVISLGHSGKGFLIDLKKYGFPVPGERMGKGGIRWCCKVFKHKPYEALMLYYRIRYTVSGVKASDSVYRRKHVRKYGWILRYGWYTAIRPLFDLTDVDVWTLIKHMDHETYNKLAEIYQKYGGSHNCILCPLMSKTKTEKLFSTLDEKTLEQYKYLLLELLKRYRNGTYTKQKLNTFLEIIEKVKR